MKRIQAPHYWLTALLAAALAASFAQAQPKGKSIAATGELIDMWCYYEGGDHGPSHKACATACAKVGNPIGLLQKNGQVYVLAGMQDHQPAKDVLVDHTPRDDRDDGYVPGPTPSVVTPANVPRRAA